MLQDIQYIPALICTFTYTDFHSHICLHIHTVHILIHCHHICIHHVCSKKYFEHIGNKTFGIKMTKTIIVCTGLAHYCPQSHQCWASMNPAEFVLDHHVGSFSSRGYKHNPKCRDARPFRDHTPAAQHATRVGVYDCRPHTPGIDIPPLVTLSNSVRQKPQRSSSVHSLELSQLISETNQSCLGHFSYFSIFEHQLAIKVSLLWPQCGWIPSAGWTADIPGFLRAVDQ